jgi:hypothetical protein
MTDRAGTLLGGRRERLERLLGRKLRSAPAAATDLDDAQRDYLLGEAKDLYWNDLEWEHITDEEALEEGPLVELAFPGFLAYIRGLLLREVMPDALAPPNPQPVVVEEVLAFLAERVVELEDGRDDDADEKRSALLMTNRLIDLVLYRYHDLAADEIERVEAAGGTSS